MQHENFKSEMSDIELMQVFIENDAPRVTDDRNESVQYGVYLPLADNADEDTNRVNRLIKAITDTGLHLKNFRQTGQITEAYLPEKGAFHGNMTVTRETLTQGMNRYKNARNIQDDLSLEDYAKQSGRPVMLCMEFNLNQQDIEHVRAVFKQKIAELETEEPRL